MDTIGVVMATMVVGLLVVAAGAAGFGLALFGRRPVPQPATGSTAPPVGAAAPARRLPRVPALLRRPAGDDVAPTRWVRIRAALLLALTILGLAALIGGVLSVLVVGLVLLAT